MIKDKWRIVQQVTYDPNFKKYSLEREVTNYIFWKRWKLIAASDDAKELEQRRFLIKQKEFNKGIYVVKEWND